MTRTPLKKLNKNYKGVITYFLLLWFSFISNALLVGHSDFWVFLVVASLFLADQILALCCICKDPGFLVKDP